MSKRSKVPRGSIKKERCDCGRYYYPVSKNDGTITNKCEICVPIEEKKK